MVDFVFWFSLFLIVSFGITYLIKKYTKQQTFVLFSMIRTKKPLHLFDLFSKHKKFLEWFSTIGLILGFGAFAVDYLFFRKQPRGKRILLFLLSSATLTVFFYLFDSFLGNFVSQSPLTSNYFFGIAIVFGILGFAGFVILTLLFQGLDIVAKMLMGMNPADLESVKDFVEETRAKDKRVTKKGE